MHCRVNSAFHPSRVGKSRTSLLAGVKAGRVHLCVGWQVTLCDPIWQVTPCSPVTRAIHFFNVLTFIEIVYHYASSVVVVESCKLIANILRSAAAAGARGVARNLFLGGIKFWGRHKPSIRMFNSRSDVISTPQKFTWTDFVGIYTHIPPSLRRWLGQSIHTSPVSL